MLSDPTDRDAVSKTLVRTYDSRSYADAWDAVEDYRQVRRYVEQHPNKGSSAVSSALELPRGRIRGWVDGDRKPDPMNALEKADGNGWLVNSWDDEHANGLNVLSAWLLASGSIDTDWWRPRWVVEDDGDVEHLLSAARQANVNLKRARTGASKPTEYVPESGQYGLGRLLSLWTGLQGNKSQDLVEFPQYPTYAPDEIATAFVRTYVRLRGTQRNDREHTLIQIQADRSDAFRRDLVDLLRRVVNSPGDVSGGSWPVYISKAAASEFLTDDISDPVDSV